MRYINTLWLGVHRYTTGKSFEVWLQWDSMYDISITIFMPVPVDVDYLGRHTRKGGSYGVHFN